MRSGHLSSRSGHRGAGAIRLKLAFERLLRRSGVDTYAYFVTDKRRPVEPFILSNYPQPWLDAYREGSYHLIDPVIRHGLGSNAPFSWRQAQERSDDSERLFELASHYRLHAGATFTLHDAQGRFAALSVCNPTGERSFDRHLMERAAHLQMALIGFHERILASRWLNEWWGATADCQLSKRELGVLYWVSMGKAYREIAQLCTISERTVKFHMANIVDKLGVDNAKQAVYEAKRQGLCV
ncbi:MAG: LuxR family transcriptional regulator [Paucimonas sp.]|nr:LuxR family transcriptional regulator [Pantoea sp. Cy-639]MDR2307967.1 LuxR family transcriptional regulator [Paucimonas sp.]NIF16592.1 LuxR family transcriptional regulator [Pantoea sp. Cy-639]